MRADELASQWQRGKEAAAPDANDPVARQRSEETAAPDANNPVAQQRSEEATAPDANDPTARQECPVTAIRDPREAYDAARAKVASGAYDALIVTGSLYLISDLISEGFEQ
jgi:folylpolyglutamate synthase/dihydropteroate synthase